MRPVTHTHPSKDDLLRREDDAWAELQDLLGQLTAEELGEDGYYPDWSVKDLMAHYGDWMAEAATMFERIRMGTYARWAGDTDALNREWHEAWRGADLHAVTAHLHAARARMLEEWGLLPPDRLDDEAREWFLDSTAGHNEEHLPRLREWIAELRSGSG
jgi:Mycothiol maleylpyruvate isomerase N-terminal domain